MNGSAPIADSTEPEHYHDDETVTQAQLVAHLSHRQPADDADTEVRGEGAGECDSGTVLLPSGRRR